MKNILGDLDNISFLPRKPKPMGTELKAACGAMTRIVTWIEIQEGQDRMRKKKFATEIGVQGSVVARLAEEGSREGDLICGDSWFASVKAAVKVSKLGRHFIGPVKTCHAGFPKSALEAIMAPLPGGSKIVMTTTFDGVPLLAIGYKYSRSSVRLIQIVGMFLNVSVAAVN